MNTVTGFKPISNASADTLILGSMPGVRSLEAHEYYAHPRNAFWRIMASIFNFDADAPYDVRVASLQASGVAVWDVLHTCIRPGSLDNSIVPESRVLNDFSTFFSEHPYIKQVGFNGAEAQKIFNKYIQPTLSTDGIKFVRLPSTSPAHAISLEKKIKAWKEALGS